MTQNAETANNAERKKRRRNGDGAQAEPGRVAQDQATA